MNEPVDGITALPDEQNARYFHVDVNGPSDVSKTVHLHLKNEVIFVQIFNKAPAV